MNKELETLKDIRQMMERSSRFISLSGWSGVAAGVCALIGAALAQVVINNHDIDREYATSYDLSSPLLVKLLLIGAGTFIAAFLSAFFFTYRKSKHNNTPIWSSTVRRLMWSVILPMAAGGIFLIKIIHLQQPGLVSPGCLIFYGIALFSGSKQTLNEIKYLGYAEIVLGIICLCFTGYGIYFGAVGFGLLHIIYGIYMWLKYERR